jgi:hypothetical protein
MSEGTKKKYKIHVYKIQHTSSVKCSIYRKKRKKKMKRLHRSR